MKIIKFIFAYFYLHILLHFECKRMGIKNIPILRVKFRMKVYGSANKKFNRVTINIGSPFNEWHLTLLHELRHIWQFENCEGVVNWCQKYLEKYSKSNKKYYFLDPLEMDTYLFEQRKGKMFDSFITKLDQSILNDMYQKNIFFDCMIQIICDYHIHACEEYLLDVL